MVINSKIHLIKNYYFVPTFQRAFTKYLFTQKLDKILKTFILAFF